jgi:hypothetical protein
MHFRRLFIPCALCYLKNFPDLRYFHIFTYGFATGSPHLPSSVSNLLSGETFSWRAWEAKHLSFFPPLDKDH